MGLSQSSRVRNSDQKIGPTELSAYQKSFYAASLSVHQAVQLRLWLENMQKQLQTTATQLRKNPSSILSFFQKTLNRPSYFLAPKGTAENWVVLLGPRTRSSVPRVRTVEPEPKSTLKHLARFPRLLQRIHQQATLLEQRLIGQETGLESFSYQEMAHQRQLSLSLGRKAQRLRKRIRRGRAELGAGQGLFDRMFLLQVQRLHALTDRAEVLAHTLHKAHIACRQAARQSRRSMSLPSLVTSPGFFRLLHQWLMHPIIDTR